MWIPYGGENTFIFGGDQRSCGVTGGQTLKTFLTLYLNEGCLDRFCTSHGVALNPAENS